MKDERPPPLRQRMIEDMRIRGMAEKTQAAHIRAVRDVALFLKRSPDTATPEELRACQLQMTNAGMTATTFNVRIVSLRFFFGVTCGRDERKRHMQFRRAPRKLPAVPSIEEVGDILAAAPGPGLKYRAALGISHGAGLRAAEVCHLRVQDIDGERMIIHVEAGKAGRDRKAMLSPGLPDLRRDCWREARPAGRPAVPRPAEGQSDFAAPVEPRLRVRQAYGGRDPVRDVAYPAPQLRHTSAGDRERRAGDPGLAGAHQTDHDRPLHACRHEDDPEHRRSVRTAQGSAGLDPPTRAGVTVRRGDPAEAGAG